MEVVAAEVKETIIEVKPVENAVKVGRSHRSPRLPTKYNLYMQKEIENLKISQPSLNNRERFKLAAENWRCADENPKSQGIVVNHEVILDNSAIMLINEITKNTAAKGNTLAAKSAKDICVALAIHSNLQKPIDDKHLVSLIKEARDQNFFKLYASVLNKATF